MCIFIISASCGLFAFILFILISFLFMVYLIKITRGNVPGLISALKCLRSSGVDDMVKDWNMCPECSWLGTVRQSVELTGNTPAGPCLYLFFRVYLKQNLNTTYKTFCITLEQQEFPDLQV